MGVRWMDHPALASFGDVHSGDLLSLDAIYGPEEVLHVDETHTTLGVDVLRIQLTPRDRGQYPTGATERFIIRGAWERCLWWPATPIDDAGMERVREATTV